MANLLNLLTKNQHIVRYPFEATGKIIGIPPELFDNGYMFLSFNVISLFINIAITFRKATSVKSETHNHNGTPTIWFKLPCTLLYNKDSYELY